MNKDLVLALKDIIVHGLHFALVSMETHSSLIISTLSLIYCDSMTRLCVMKVLKDHVQFLSQI